MPHPRPDRRTVIRWLSALLLLLSAFACVDRGAEIGTIAAVPVLLMGAACAILAAVCVSPDTAMWAAKPFTGLIDSIYFGSAGSGAPPLDLKLARLYRREGRLEEAIVEYEKNHEWYPGNLDVIEEGILTLRAAGETEKAEGWAAAARKRLKEDWQEERIRQALSSPAVPPVDRYY